MLRGVVFAVGMAIVLYFFAERGGSPRLAMKGLRLGPGAKLVRGTMARTEPYEEGPTKAVGYLLTDPDGTLRFVGEGLGEEIEGTAEPFETGYRVRSKFGGTYHFVPKA